MVDTRITDNPLILILMTNLKKEREPHILDVEIPLYLKYEVEHPLLGLSNHTTFHVG